MKRYLVWCPGRGQTKDDACHVDAVDAMAAALKWAEENSGESADLMIGLGLGMMVIVAEVNIPKRQVEFIVSLEFVPRYSARAVVQP